MQSTQKHGMRWNDPVKFQIYYARTSLMTLCIACLIACGLVCLGILLFGHKTISLFAIIMCVITCLGTMILGGIMIYRKAAEISRPLVQISEKTKEIAKGNFEVEVPQPDLPVMEIRTLNDNFNLMAGALKKMEYMNKDFMNNVSHEFKTPISVIAGFAEILQDENLPEEDRKEYLGLIEEEAERLSHLADNMLQMSRLDHQTIVMKRKEVNISEQLRKACIMIAEKWESRSPEFDIDLPELTVSADPDLTQQIWINLLDNAVKYSSGEPVIHITGSRFGNNVRIRIRDEGMGMTEEQMERMYDRFYQADESRQQQGNGLGLSIVRRILELLEGDIRCHSVAEKGTEFEICLKTS